MENSIAAILGPVWLMFGLSILLYPKQWSKLMDKWEKEHFLLFPVMLMAAVLGLIVIRMHNVWEWNLNLLVTLAGWGMFLKSALYFLLPGSLIKASLTLGRNMGFMYFGSLIALVAGGVLSYYNYLA